MVSVQRSVPRTRRASTMGEMKHDYGRLLREELADFSSVLHGLDDSQWDRPSLCEGWRVRDVIGHMCVGYQMKLSAFPMLLVKYRGNVAPGWTGMSGAFGSAHTPDEIVA